jgi:hypothetical protein
MSRKKKMARKTRTASLTRMLNLSHPKLKPDKRTVLLQGMLAIRTTGQQDRC